MQLCRAGVLDDVALAGADVDARVRLERMRLSLEDEGCGAGDDVEKLVAAVLAPLERLPGREAKHALLEQPGVDRDRLVGSVALGAAAVDITLAKPTVACRIGQSHRLGRDMSMKCRLCRSMSHLQ